MASPPDIFLLTIDALRADHLSCFGYHRETPVFDSLYEDWIGFTNAYSVSSHTREAMPPILSGVYPERFVANGFTRPPDVETVAGKLSASGYATGGFHSNPYLSRAFGYDSGFDTFYDDLMFGRSKFVALAQQALDRFVFNRGEYYARSPEINRRALNWLDETDSPIFLWNHYMDTHGPYHPPSPHHADQGLSANEAENLYRKASNRTDSITRDERQLLIDSYDDEIRCLERQLKSFLEALEARDRLENSLVIITADHGDGFGERGYFAHPRYLHDELIHVPLLISSPVDTSNKTVSTIVSTLDIAPTILHCADLNISELPGNPLITKSGVREPSDDRVVFASVAGEGDQEGIRRYAARTLTMKAFLECEIGSGEIVSEHGCTFEGIGDERPGDGSSDSVAEHLQEKLRVFSKSQLNSTDGLDHSYDQGHPTEIKDRLRALGYR